LKKVILHIGLPKTGSSAIQNFLARNGQNLERSGFFYQSPPVRDQYEITTGNAAPLWDIIKTRSRQEAGEFTSKYLKPDYINILSSEVLAQAQEEDWKFLQEIFHDNDIYLENIIFFVRDVFPFLNSAYDQAIKRHGMTKDFYDWIKLSQNTKTGWDHYITLTRINKNFLKTKIKAIHYNDSFSRNSTKTFLSILGIENSFNENKVNRSLINLERDYLLKINRIIGASLGNKLSDHLIYKNPNFPSEKISITPEEKETILQTYQEQVAWVNSNFFDCKPVVSCFAQEDPLTTRNLTFETDEISNSVHAAIIDFLISEMQVDRCEQYFSELLKLGKCPQIISEDLPKDFDPIHYLLLNPDVFRAGADPAEHYRNHGVKEGRAYRIPSS
jgi:hypothetical protein